MDNVVWNGLPADPEYTDTSGDVEGIRKLLKVIQGDEEVDATTIATVGERGYDDSSMLSRNDKFLRLVVVSQMTSAMKIPHPYQGIQFAVLVQYYWIK